MQLLCQRVSFWKKMPFFRPHIFKQMEELPWRMTLSKMLLFPYEKLFSSLFANPIHQTPLHLPSFSFKSFVKLNAINFGFSNHWICLSSVGNMNGCHLISGKSRVCCRRTSHFFHCRRFVRIIYQEVLRLQTTISVTWRPRFLLTTKNSRRFFVVSRHAHTVPNEVSN